MEDIGIKKVRALYFKEKEVLFEVLVQKDKIELTEQGFLALSNRLHAITLENFQKTLHASVATPESKPIIPSAVSVPEPLKTSNAQAETTTAVTTESKKWSEAHVAELKRICKKVNIENYNNMNPWVKSWSLEQLSSYKDLTPDNVDGFLKYVRTKVLYEQA